MRRLPVCMLVTPLAQHAQSVCSVPSPHAAPILQVAEINVLTAGQGLQGLSRPSNAGGDSPPDGAGPVLPGAASVLPAPTGSQARELQQLRAKAEALQAQLASAEAKLAAHGTPNATAGFTGGPCAGLLETPCCSCVCAACSDVPLPSLSGSIVVLCVAVGFLLQSS